MAEFCIDCFNKMNHTHYTEKDVLLDDDLCEGCAEIKPCIMVFRKDASIFSRIRWAIEDYRHHSKKPPL